MSSILKALQRLEKDKAAKEERPVRLAWEVMRPDRSQRSFPIGLVLIVLCTLAVGIGGTALWMGRGEEVSFSNSPIQVEVVTPKVVVPVAKQSPKPEPKKLIKKVVAPVVPIPATGGQSISKADGLQLSLLDHRAGTDGIAVINDLPVMEGTSIEGYRVIAILPDKVLLEKGGKVFFVVE